MPKMVRLEPPKSRNAIIAALETLLNRVRQGEFETVFIVGFTQSGHWVTIQRGARLDPLRAFGVMESIKADILAASETGEPSGL